MATYKLPRGTEDMKREISDIMRSLKDPRVSGLISIVKLELSGDLSHCKIWISSLDGLEAAKSAVAGLKSATGFMKHELSLRMKMRRIPDLHFFADDSISHSADISKTLGKIL